MFPETAAILKVALADVQSTVVYNIGSNTWAHYHDDQHWIWDDVLKPLLDRGCLLVNIDPKGEIGQRDGIIHIALTLEQAALIHKPTRLALCTSTAEHVHDHIAFARTLGKLVEPEGVLWLEVPSVYPIHHDPIDNGMRWLTPKDISTWLGGGWQLEEAHEIVSKQFPGDGTEGKGLLVKARRLC